MPDTGVTVATSAILTLGQVNTELFCMSVCLSLYNHLHVYMYVYIYIYISISLGLYIYMSGTRKFFTILLEMKMKG